MDDSWDFLKKQRNDGGGVRRKGDVLLQPWAFPKTKTCRCKSSGIYKRAGRVDSGSRGWGGPLAAQIGRGSALLDADGRGRREARSFPPHLSRLMYVCQRSVYFEKVGPRRGGEGVRWRDCVERLLLSSSVFVLSYNEEDPRFCDIQWLREMQHKGAR